MDAKIIEFGSVCSGIEAASVAWEPLGWRAAWLAEIEPFPSAVLAHHYPEVPNLGDMTQLVRRILTGEVEAPDVFTGGTPCQAFSVAGKRESLDDARGNLSLTFCEIANAIDHIRRARGLDPSIVVWENVPGVLSTRDNAFGCFLASLAGSGCELLPSGHRPGQPVRWTDAGCVYGPQRAVAWRVLDAQYFGLAQRRRRVFVVASARNGFDPAAVLFERDGVRRDTAPRRETGQDAASSVGIGAGSGWPANVASTLNAAFGNTQGLEDQHALSGAPLFVPAVCPTLRAGGNSTGGDRPPGTDVDTADSLIAFSCKDHAADAADDLAPTLRAIGHAGSHANAGGQVAVAFRVHGEHSTAMTGGGAANVADPVEVARCLDSSGGYATNQGGNVVMAPVAFHENQRAEVTLNDTAGAVKCVGGKPGQGYPAVLTQMAVRRLTPRECERLQGFPDDYTEIPWRGKPAEQCPDGPRYKALGNSWAVPCARWIGQRIAAELAA